MYVNKSKLPQFNPAVLPKEYVPVARDNNDEKHPRHYLTPGKLFATREPAAIVSIAGSGVVLCICDSLAGVGGVANFLLPEDIGGEPNAKFGGHASRQLLKEVLALGADPNRLQARIFGGSEPPTTFSSSYESLGQRNVRVAVQFLTTEGIRLVDQQTGGASGRRVIFHTDDGTAWVQKL